MLLGQYEGKIGEKFQAAFPKKYREILGKSLIVTKGPDRNLIAVSEANWQTLLEGTEGKPFIDKQARGMQTFLLGNASEVTLDDQGRFVIPEYLRTYASLEKDIVFVGINRYVQIWSKQKWDEHQEYLAHTIDAIAEKLSGNERVNE